MHWNTIEGALTYALTVTPDIGEIILPKTAQSAIVKNLAPSVTYDFSWVAVFDFGQTDATEAKQGTAPPPPQIAFSDVRSSTFQLSWNDENYCKDYNVDFIPAAEERVRIKRTNHKMINLKANTNYEAIVSCNVGYGVTDDAVLSVSTNVAPPLISVADLRSSSARVTWSSNAAYTRFEMTLDSVAFQAAGSKFQMSAEDDSMSFDNLEASTWYTVSLVTFTQDGRTDDVEVTFQTAPAPPQMSFEAIWSSEAILVWNEHERIKHYLIKFEPEIGLIPAKVMGSRLPLTNLPSLSSYNVSIIGVGDGFMTDSISTDFKTAPASPDVAISNVSTSKFTISWSTVPEAATVEIEIYPYPANVPHGILQLPQTQRNYEFTMLEPETKYYVKLSCIINGRTRTNIVQQSQLTAPSAPTLIANNVTSTGLNIAWSPVEDVAYYVLNIFPTPPGIHQDYQLIENQLSVGNLENDTPYNIEVKAVLATGPITDSGLSQIRTAPPPPTIIVQTVRTTWAKLIYTPVKNIKSYKINVFPPVGRKTDFSRNSTKLDFWALKPNVQYTISVQGVLDYAMTDVVSIAFDSGNIYRLNHRLFNRPL